jgi:hypothetical protein
MRRFARDFDLEGGGGGGLRSMAILRSCCGSFFFPNLGR